MLKINRLLLSSISGLICVLALQVPLGFSQMTGKVSGRVVDSSSKEALPGVNVIIEGTSLGAATDPAGEFFILAVPPGLYELQFSFIGYKTLTLSNVQIVAGRTTEQNILMESTALEGQEITVTAQRPTIIRDLTASADFISGDVAVNAPVQGARDLITLTPNVILNESGNLIVRGGETNEVGMYIDGVKVGESFNNGRSGGATGNPTWMFDQNVLGIQEIEVITGGFNAEYGNAQSGIVRMVTREGGQKFHGQVHVEYGPPGQYHFGPYLYSTNTFEWQKYGNIAYWNDIFSNSAKATLKNNLLSRGLTTPQAAFDAWEQMFTPGPDHRGGAYDYTKLSYKNIAFGFGGPLGRRGKAAFYVSGTKRYMPAVLPNINHYFPYDNYDGNVVYRPRPTMKLRIKGSYSTFTRNRQVGGWDVTTQGLANAGKLSLLRWNPYNSYLSTQSVTWTHTVNPKTFYELTLSHQWEKQEAIFWMIAGNQNWWWMPNVEWMAGYTPNNVRQFCEGIMGKTHKYYAYGNITSQITTRHQVKAGFEYNYMHINNASDADPSTLINTTYWGTYVDAYPQYMSMYIQDKIEFSDFVANLGLRGELYNSNTLYFTDQLNPFYVGQLQPRSRGNPEQGYAPEKFRLAPRVGISHPISEFTAFHFQYGHFYSVPDYFRQFQLMNYAGYRNYANPDLDFQKTVSYEFGIQHNLFRTHRLNLVGFYNDLDDQLTSVIYHSDVGEGGAVKGFTNNLNHGYGESKGIEITLESTAGHDWYYRWNYTLTRSTRGNYGVSDIYSLDPYDARNWLSRKSANSTVRGSDRVHVINLLVQYQVPPNSGPAIAGFHPLSEVSVSTTFRYYSGYPYTLVLPDDPFKDMTMNRRWPGYHLTDLKIQKYIQIGSFPYRPLLIVRITNLLNNKVLRQRNTERWTKYNELQGGYINAVGYQLDYGNETRRIIIGVGINF